MRLCLVIAVVGFLGLGRVDVCSGGAATPCVDPSGAPITKTYCNTSASLEDRVQDFVAAMNDTERAAALQTPAPAIPRLGAPQFTYGEALHGAAQGCIPPPPGSNSTGCPTSFPAACALGASFDPELFHEVGAAIGAELRGLSNYHTEGLMTGSLSVFAPNINLVRDPRWGRAQEVPGEDPYLTSEYVAAYARGMQGVANGGGYLQAVSTGKHFSAYDVEGFWNGSTAGNTWSTDGHGATCTGPSQDQCRTERWNMDARPAWRDYVGYYLPAWEAAVSAGIGSVMCSYNAVFGVPSCLSGNLTGGVLREQLGFDGFVVSDYMAPSNAMNCSGWKPPSAPGGQPVCEPFSGHAYDTDPMVTLNETLSAGTDSNLGELFKYFLAAGISTGKVPRSAVNTAIARVYTKAFQLGLFDPDDAVPWRSVPPDVVDSQDHRALALRAARESLVLLRNDGDLLPLAPRTDEKPLSVAFIGPHANATQALLSNYHGDNKLVNDFSPLMCASRVAGVNVTYSKGCNICDAGTGYPGYPNSPCPQPSTNTSGFAAAVEAAGAADVAVVFIGSDQTVEAEGFDRGGTGGSGGAGYPRGIRLAGVQEELAQAVLAAQPRTVVVLISGGTLAIEGLVGLGADNSPPVPAILQAFYGGELGGQAIVDALFGAAGAAPAGRLPATMYFQNFTALRDMRDMSLRANASDTRVDSAGNPGITYLHFNQPVVFPFGFGLSYGAPTFRVNAQQVFISTSESEVEVNISVALPGSHRSDVVVTVFVCGFEEDVRTAFAASDLDAAKSRPLRQLLWTTRLRGLEPDGIAATVSASIKLHSLTSVREDGARRLLPGRYSLVVGGQGGAGACDAVYSADAGAQGSAHGAVPLSVTVSGTPRTLAHVRSPFQQE